IRNHIDRSSNRIEVEKKSVTMPKRDLYCNKVVPGQLCYDTLTDGSVIIQYKWEKQ
ncbi:hypothetical protein LCGC14_0866490, partial [marine sediment metagenome]